MKELRDLVVLPTYNERENLPLILDRIRGLGEPPEVLVVDDNSPDGTADLARDRQAKDPGVHLLVRPGKGGLRSAYQAGFAWGLARGYDLLYEMDADLSHDPEVLPELRAAVVRGADVALGSRYVVGGGTEGWPLLRQCVSRGGNLYARVILGLRARDVTGGFRGYRAAALRRLEPDSLTAQGYVFQVELLYRARRVGLSVAEVPILFRNRKHGKSKMSPRIFLEALVAVWRLKLSRWSPRASPGVAAGGGG